MRFFGRGAQLEPEVSLFFFNTPQHGDNGDSAPKYSIFEPFSGYFEYKRLYHRRKRGLYIPLRCSTESILGGRALIGSLYVLAETLVTLKRYLAVKWRRTLRGSRVRAAAEGGGEEGVDGFQIRMPR